MNIYSDQNPPKKGTALKIYQALVAEGWKVVDLHWNRPAWGNLKAMGYSTWACQIIGPDNMDWELWCGIEGGIPYLQSSVRPFNRYTIEGSFDGLNA
jgi:hypothetical protein